MVRTPRVSHNVGSTMSKSSGLTTAGAGIVNSVVSSPPGNNDGGNNHMKMYDQHVIASPSSNFGFSRNNNSPHNLALSANNNGSPISPAIATQIQELRSISTPPETPPRTLRPHIKDSVLSSSGGNKRYYLTKRCF